MLSYTGLIANMIQQMDSSELSQSQETIVRRINKRIYGCSHVSEAIDDEIKTQLNQYKKPLTNVPDNVRMKTLSVTD